MNTPNKSINVLIITTSGGRGHIEAAKAKKQEILKENQSALIFEKDVLKNWAWKFISKRLRAWALAQMFGKIQTLMRLVNMQKYAEWILAPRIFLSFLKIMFEKDIDRIIDTQNLGLPSILKALRLYNWIKNKNVYLERVIVDLPTKDTTTFFPSIRKINKKDRRQLRLITIPPLLEEESTDSAFWEKHCHMDLKQISYEKEFIRQSLKEIQKKPPIGDMELQFEMTDEIKPYLKKILNSEIFNSHLRCTIKQEDILITIMLGAEPAINGTLAYLQGILEYCYQLHTHPAIHIIVFVSHYHLKFKSLLESVCEIVQSRKLPEKIQVLPVCFQNEDVIAKLMYRSNLTISRSGGHTAMELLALRKNKETWIHSETNILLETQSLNALLAGMPQWEAGNARYLINQINAKVVNSSIFPSQVRAFFEKHILIIGEKLN